MCPVSLPCARADEDRCPRNGPTAWGHAQIYFNQEMKIFIKTPKQKSLERYSLSEVPCARGSFASSG
jgi:hypothetical protein